MSSQKKREILNAAMELLLREGEQASSMKRIGEKAGCGMGTMYHYFKSKDILINELFLDIHSQKQSFQKALLLTQGSVKKRFVALCSAELSFAQQFPLECTFSDAYSDSPIISNETKQACRAFHNNLKNILQEGLEQEIVKESDLNTLLSFVKGGLRSITITKDTTDLEIEKIVNIAWDAVKA